MASLNSRLSDLACLSLNHRKISIAIICLAAALAVLGLSRLGFSDGHESVFASSTSEYTDYQEFADRFSATNTNVALLISSQKEFSKPDLLALQDLVLDLHLVDGVQAVFSVFSLQKSDPDYGGYLSAFGGFEDADSITPLLEEASKQTFSGMKLVSEALNETVVVVTFEPSMTDLKLADSALQELNSVAQGFSNQSALKAEITGLLPVRNWVVNQIRIDQPVINALGAVLGFLVSLVIFRSFWIALLNGVASVFALVLSLGMIGLFGFSINVLNTALPVLVLVLASSDCTHITYEFCRQSQKGGNPETAIRTALLEMISPCALTSLTTAFAFATLYYSPSPIIRELAISGSLCVLAAFFAVLLVHPLVFLTASRFLTVRAAMKRPLPVATTGQSTLWFFSMLIAGRRWVVSAGLILTAFLIWLIFPIQTNYSFSENIRSDNPLVITMNEVERLSGPMTALEIPLVSDTGKVEISPALISEVQAIHTRLEKKFPAYPVVSLHTITRFLSAEGNPTTPAAIGELLDLLPEQYLNRVVSKRGDGFLVSMMIPDLGSAALRKLGEDISRELATVSTQLLEIKPQTGMLAMSAQLSDQMIRQLMISFLLVALLCPFFIGFWFGELKFIWVAFLPNLLPILTIGAWMMMSGAHVQFTSALAMTIAFGIAVDDTIHVFNRISLGSDSQADRTSPAALASAMAHVSPALATTTFILMSGLIVVLWSEMPMIEYFGLLCVSTFALALIADIVLLPAIAAMVFAKPLEPMVQTP